MPVSPLSPSSIIRTRAGRTNQQEASFKLTQSSRQSATGFGKHYRAAISPFLNELTNPQPCPAKIVDEARSCALPSQEKEHAQECGWVRVAPEETEMRALSKQEAVMRTYKMSSVLVIYACLAASSICSAPAFADASATLSNASNNPQIITDDKTHTVHIVIDGRDVVTIDSAGLHVNGEVSYTRLRPQPVEGLPPPVQQKIPPQ